MNNVELIRHFSANSFGKDAHVYPVCKITHNAAITCLCLASYSNTVDLDNVRFTFPWVYLNS